MRAFVLKFDTCQISLFKITLVLTSTLVSKTLWVELNVYKYIIHKKLILSLSYAQTVKGV